MPNTDNIQDILNLPVWHVVTSDEFKAGTKKEQDMYLLSDTGEIYRGEVCYTRFSKFYDEIPTNPVVGRLYISTSTFEGRIWDGSAWHVIIQGTDVTNKNIQGVAYDATERILTVTTADGTAKNIVIDGLAGGITLSADGKLGLTDASGNAVGEQVDLTTVASKVTVDGTSIVDNEGTLSVAGFGSAYYAYVEADNILESNDSYVHPDNMPEGVENAFVKVAGIWYKFTSGSWIQTNDTPNATPTYNKVNGWKAGLEPKVIGSEGSGFTIAWYEPSTTTMEGLSSAMATVQATVAAMQDKIDAVTAKAEKAIADAATNKAAIDVLNGDATTDGSVAHQVAQAIAEQFADAPENLDTMKELVDWITTHGTDAAKMASDIKANADAITALETLVGTLPEGTSATTVIAYIDAAISAIEIPEIDTTKFATAEQGAKADTAIQSVAASETNGNVVVDGTEVQVYRPVDATNDAAGIVLVDNTTVAINGDGKLSIKQVTTDLITNLNTTIQSVIDAALETLNDTLDEKFVPKTAIATSVDLTAPSDERILSEKAILEALTWKTTM